MEEYDEGLHTPKMTPCLHTFCATCVVDLISGPSGCQQGQGTKNIEVPRGKGLMCPLCREMVSTNRMQTNRYVLAHLRDLMRLKALQPGGTQEAVPQEPQPQALTHQQQKLEQRQQKLEHRQQKRQQRELWRQQRQQQKQQLRQQRKQQKQESRNKAPLPPPPKYTPPLPPPKHHPPPPPPYPPGHPPKHHPPPPPPYPPGQPPKHHAPPPPPYPPGHPPKHHPPPPPPYPPGHPPKHHPPPPPPYPPGHPPKHHPPPPPPYPPGQPPHSPQNAPPPQPFTPGQPLHIPGSPGRLYPDLFNALPFFSAQVQCPPCSPPPAPPSPPGCKEATRASPAGLQRDSVSLMPSAPPAVDGLEDMWCRTCEEPARPNICTTHHLTPLLKGEEIEWIERQQKQERSRRQQETEQRQQEQQRQEQEETQRRQQQETEQRKKQDERQKRQQEDKVKQRREDQEEEDLKLALKLAGVTIEDIRACQSLTTDSDRCGVDCGSLGSGSSGNTLDLSHWTYAQIRDVINTSCEPQLLQDCHKEFDRRRQEYHRTIRRRVRKTRAPLIP